MSVFASWKFMELHTDDLFTFHVVCYPSVNSLPKPKKKKKNHKSIKSIKNGNMNLWKVSFNPSATDQGLGKMWLIGVLKEV